jgi:hypothetical protein
VLLAQSGKYPPHDAARCAQNVVAPAKFGSLKIANVNRLGHQVITFDKE